MSLATALRLDRTLASLHPRLPRLQRNLQHPRFLLWSIRSDAFCSESDESGLWWKKGCFGGDAVGWGWAIEKDCESWVSG